MKKNFNILLIEDDEDDYFIIRELLSKIAYFKHNFHRNSRVEEMAGIDTNTIDLCIADYFLGKDTALDILKLFKKQEINIPVIVLTGINNRAKDIEVMEAGATDYLNKDTLNSDKLERAIRYAIQQNTTLLQYKTERNKFQKLFDLNTDLIIILNNNFEVNDINNQVLKTLGIESKSSVIGMNITDLIIKPTAIDLLTPQSNIINKDLSLLFYNQVEIEAILSLTEIFSANNLTECYQIIIKDITEVTKAKNRLRNIEKVNFSGKMAQTLVHEIRNPLTNINLSVSFLKASLPEDEKFLNMILKNSCKINDLTTQFINNTKEIKLNKEAVTVNFVLEKAIELCLDRIALKNISLKLAIDSTETFTILADTEKLSIAISNLILNATEALNSSKNPEIRVETQVKKGLISIDVYDNGTGISHEKLATIFEPFATDKLTGIGIGLSSVYNIVTLHNWDIEVNSILGKGTCFHILIETED